MSASKNTDENILLYKDSNKRVVSISKKMWTNPTWIQKKAVRDLKNKGFRELGENESIIFRGAHHEFKLEPKNKKDKARAKSSIEPKEEPQTE